MAPKTFITVCTCLQQQKREECDITDNIMTTIILNGSINTKF